MGGIFPADPLTRFKDSVDIFHALSSLWKELNCNAGSKHLSKQVCLTVLPNDLLCLLQKHILDLSLNQINELLSMTSEQKTKLKWRLLLERSRIYLKVSVFRMVVFYKFKW